MQGLMLMTHYRCFRLVSMPGLPGNGFPKLVDCQEKSA